MPLQATRTAWRAGAVELAASHPVMDRLLSHHGPPRPGPGAGPAARFEALASSIAYQQLAGKAAASIWARVVAEVGTPFDPAAVLAAGSVRLRACGLSNAKVAALLDLATKSADGTLRLDRIARLSDQEVIDHVTVVRGIGPWTAQMFLMFDLRRLDVWPTGDHGVRAGFAKAFSMDAMPTERELGILGQPFAPYRSVVAWWCWREADTVTRSV